MNDFQCCTVYNARAMLWHLLIIELLLAFMCKMGSVDVATPSMSIYSVSTILGVAYCIIEGVCCGTDV
jgi:hypothetical protein